jgi:hypothetical protein
MDDFSRIIFKVTEDYFGLPYPHVETGTILILIQDGQIEFSRYQEPTKDNPFVSFSHPIFPEKNSQLLLSVEHQLKSRFPEFFRDNTSVVLTCPLGIADLLIWT